jgi:hypothetical protein
MQQKSCIPNCLGPGIRNFLRNSISGARKSNNFSTVFEWLAIFETQLNGKFVKLSDMRQVCSYIIEKITNHLALLKNC